MSTRVVIPKDIKLKLVAAVRERLDIEGYFSQGLSNNSQLLDELAADSNIGGVLNQYMKKEKVRTYIKDCIIGKYAKAKNSELLLTDKIINDLERVDGGKLSIIKDKEQVLVAISEYDGAFIYAAKGTVLKWESALRKLLENRANLNSDANMTIRLYLILSNTGRNLTESEKTNLTITLGIIGVKILLVSEH